MPKRNYFDPTAPNYEPPDAKKDTNVSVVTADKDLANELAKHLIENSWAPSIENGLDTLGPDLDVVSVVMLDEPGRELWHACMSAQVDNGNHRPVIMVWVPPEEAQHWTDTADIVVQKPITMAKIDEGLESFLGTKTGMTSKPDADPIPKSMRPGS